MPTEPIKLRRTDRKPQPVKRFTTQLPADNTKNKRTKATKARQGKPVADAKPKTTKPRETKARGKAAAGRAQQTVATIQLPMLLVSKPVPALVAAVPRAEGTGRAPIDAVAGLTAEARGTKRRLEEPHEEGHLQVWDVQPLRKDGVPLWLQRKWVLSELEGDYYPDFVYCPTKRVRIENETEGV
ncbi:hypothetical protein BDN72DRAFT_541081 [Pluteus cervinus]|uniref:Uncharacterized protein n=1 Tax=Pluteus cervinus TaxID=181527 RepID=A0ACD3A3G8_9AGAR|nr:hypothetical protein BDN72DRAFT_541081 [Pluteus cervinus]